MSGPVRLGALGGAAGSEAKDAGDTPHIGLLETVGVGHEYGSPSDGIDEGEEGGKVKKEERGVHIGD